MPISADHKRRRGRNVALAGILFGVAVLFFFITIAKLGGAS